MLEIRDIRITQTRRDILASSSLPSLESRLVYFIKKDHLLHNQNYGLEARISKIHHIPNGLCQALNQ